MRPCPPEVNMAALGLGWAPTLRSLRQRHFPQQHLSCSQQWDVMWSSARTCQEALWHCMGGSVASKVGVGIHVDVGTHGRIFFAIPTRRGSFHTCNAGTLAVDLKQTPSMGYCGMLEQPSQQHTECPTIPIFPVEVCHGRDLLFLNLSSRGVPTRA